MIEETTIPTEQEMRLSVLEGELQLGKYLMKKLLDSYSHEWPNNAQAVEEARVWAERDS